MPKVNEKTLLIVGAGFSVNLGMPTTYDIEKIIKVLLDLDIYESHRSYKPTTIDERLERLNNSLTKTKLDDIAKNDFKNTLNILFYGNGAETADEADGNYQKTVKSYKEE